MMAFFAIIKNRIVFNLLHAQINTGEKSGNANKLTGFVLIQIQKSEKSIGPAIYMYF